MQETRAIDHLQEWVGKNAPLLGVHDFSIKFALYDSSDSRPCAVVGGSDGSYSVLVSQSYRNIFPMCLRYFALVQHGPRPPKVEELDQHTIFLANCLNESCLYWLTLHEIAHIARNHCDWARQRYGATEIRNSHDTTASPLTMGVRQALEYQADSFAATRTLELFDPKFAFLGTTTETFRPNAFAMLGMAATLMLDFLSVGKSMKIDGSGESDYPHVAVRWKTSCLSMLRRKMAYAGENAEDWIQGALIAKDYLSKFAHADGDAEHWSSIADDAVDSHCESLRTRSVELRLNTPNRYGDVVPLTELTFFE